MPKPNGIDADGVLDITLEVLEPAELTSADGVTFTVGALGSFQLETTGNPESSIIVSGTLPAGVSFNTATGVLEGTPAAGTGGEHELSIEASNGVAPDALQDFTLTIHEAPSLSGAATTTFTIGSPGTYTVATAGFPVPTLSLDGSLPAGLTFNATTGAISGTPQAGTSGTYAVTLGAANGIGSAASLAVSLDVREVSSITSADATTFTVGSAGSFQVTAAGTPAPTLSATGSLPNGVSFSAATGLLAGTPDPGTGGTYSVTFGAENAVGTPSTQSFTLTVNEAPALLGAATTTFVVGQESTYATTRTGFPLPVLGLIGTLPAGLSFNSLLGTLSGTPEADTGGSHSVTITADNGVGVAATLPVTITVEEGAEFTSEDEVTFTVGAAGTFTVTASGTPAPVSSVTGDLPDGVTFTPGTGVLAGTPAAGTGGTYALTFEADNGVGTTASQSFTLTINEAPSLLGAATAAFVVGTPNSYTPGVIGSPAPTLSLLGSLPSGLSFNTSTGSITGTAAVGTGGTYPVTIGAENGIGSTSSLAVSITVNEAAAITSGNATTFTVGSAGSFTVTGTGTPAPSFGVATGSLPTGVTLSSGGSLSGTPAAGTGGTHVVTLSASNGVGSAASQSFTLTVNQAPGLSGAATATFQVGQSGSYSVTRSGFPTPTLGLTGSLPSGVSFSAATGAISGMPAVGTAGSYPLTIEADNGVGSVASLSLTLSVEDAAAITSSNATTFTVGSAGNFSVTATGSPQPTLSLTGGLPTGVTFSAATGLLSGTPAASTGGTYAVTIGADNGVGSAASQSFTLTVNQAPGLSGAATTTFQVGQSGSYAVTSSGFPTPTLGVTGSLPSGLSFSAATGTISGTPAVGTAGSYPLTIGADNGVGSAASLSVTLTVDDAPSITSSDATTFTVGSAGSFSVTGTGSPAPSFSITAGSLPSGVTLSSAGLLSGTPAASTGGTYAVTIGADNGVGSAASQSFTLTVNQAPSISGAPPSPVDADVAYSHSFTLGGFPTPTTSVVAGTLPTGLTLSAAGAITGTPTTPGTFSDITVRASNTTSFSDITFTIVVNLAVAPPSASADSFTATGNIAIDVPVGSSVLNNDTLNTGTITGFGVSSGAASTASPGGSSATAQGGSVSLAADGSFSYDPPAGTTGADSFAYTVTNAGGSSVATVTITIANRVWFVDASAALGGNGKPASAFRELTNVSSSTSGDVIYALRPVTPYLAKTLPSGQRLLGQGITVDATHLGFTLAPFSRSVFGTAGANSSMRTLTLSSSNYVRGFDVTASSGTRGLFGTSASAVDIAGMAVSTTSATAVDLNTVSGTISLESVTASGGVNGILLTGTTGSFTVTGTGTPASGGTISGTSNDGVRLNGAQNVSLSWLGISGIPSGFFGIHGNSVVNLTLSNVTTTGGTQGLSFEDNSGNPSNLSGVVAIQNCSFANHTTAIGIRNDVGTISSFTFGNNSISTITSTGFLLQIRGTARLEDMSVHENTFTSVSTTLSTNAFNVFVGTNSSGGTTFTPFAKVTVDNNTFTGSNGIPIRLRAIETNGTLHAIVRSNTVSGLTGTNTNAMRIDSGNSSGNSTVCAQIESNSFTPSGSALGISVRRDQTDTFGIVGLTPSPSSVAADVTSFLNGQNPGNTSTVVTGVTAFASGYTDCTIP